MSLAMSSNTQQSTHQPDATDLGQELKQKLSGSTDRLNKLNTELSAGEGINPTSIPDVCTFKSSVTHEKMPALYQPLICMITQGQKVCYIGESKFEYSAGDMFINFLPVPVSTQIVEASEDSPMLSSTLCIDLVRLADMILKIERYGELAIVDKTEHESSIVLSKASDELTELFVKLLETSTNPLDAKVLGDSIIDEIYYRLLTSEHGPALRTLLNQYGQIQPISKAVGFIHENLQRNIQVNELAQIANMSKTAFFTTFKKLMHLAPNQYIKATKLQKAQTLLKQGMQANSASIEVGYNSFSQFSREYKRFFGFSPSQTA